MDVADRRAILDLIRFVPASLVRKGELVPHNVGVYLQDMPIDPISGLAAFDKEQAYRHGFVKLDLLHLHVYDGVRDEEHLVNLMLRPVRWDRLTDAAFVRRHQISQIHNHAELVAAMAPTSVEQLAMIAGIIRPPKAHLRGKPWSTIEKSIWEPPPGNSDSAFFKKPHGIAYAMVIVVHLNLIEEEIAAGQRQD